MCLVDGHTAGNVRKTSDAPDPRPDLRALVHAADECNQDARGGDDEGVVEQGLGDGCRPLRSLGKSEKASVGDKEVGPLVVGIAEFPSS